MRTNYLIQQHTKCLGILEVINKCTRYLESDEKYFNEVMNISTHIRWHSYPMFEEKVMLDRIINRKAKKERLQRYYFNQMMLLIASAENKANMDGLIGIIPSSKDIHTFMYDTELKKD